MTIISEVPKLVLKDIGAEVYEGINGEFFIRIYEMRHESEVCLEASEAVALVDFINLATGNTGGESNG